MSPTILRERGYSVVIFPNDHPPPHVHVRAAGNVARIQLDPVEVMDSYGYSQRQIREIVDLVRDNQEVLMLKWKEIFPET